MSYHAITDLGPPSIHSVVAARGAALKIKQLSSSLFADRKKRLDQGGFTVTFSDDPTNPLENLPQPRQEERHRRRRSTAITPASGYEQPSERAETVHNTNRLEPGEGNRRRRSTATISSGFSEPLTDPELENVSQSRAVDTRHHRQRRYTTFTRPPTTISSGSHEFRLAEPGSHNTYRLEPDKRFEHWRVTEIIKNTFEEHLIGESYDREFCHRMSKILADLIKDQVKSLQFPRYKIISVVSIGQKRGQSVRMASRSVWDPRFDCSAQYCYEREDMYAIGVVYGVYCE